MNAEMREIKKDYEFLVEELKTEWSKSKEGKKLVRVSRESVERCKTDILKMAAILSGQSDQGGGLNLRESMELTKKAYILIRIGKKLLTATKGSGDEETFLLVFDRDEYRLFVEHYPEYR